MVRERVDNDEFFPWLRSVEVPFLGSLNSGSSCTPNNEAFEGSILIASKARDRNPFSLAGAPSAWPATIPLCFQERW